MTRVRERERVCVYEATESDGGKAISMRKTVGATPWECESEVASHAIRSDSENS